MEPINQASNLSVDHVLLHNLSSSCDDQSLSTKNNPKPIDQPARLQTTSPNVGRENEYNVPSPVSVRAIRQSMLPQPARLPQSTKSEGSSSKKSQKRKNSLFSFLSVKEPSSQALHEYEEMLRKQQNNPSGRVTAVGMPMTAASQLPAHVPKVNSKWDGVPKAIHRKERNKNDPKPKSSGSASWQSSPQSSCSSLQSLDNRLSMKSSMKRPASQGTKSISERTEAYSIRSNHPSLVRSSASTISSASTPSLSYSNYDFAINRHYTSEPASPQCPVPSPLKSSVVAVVNLSSSRNSPDSIDADLQFSTTFPFPENLKDQPASTSLLSNPTDGTGPDQPKDGDLGLKPSQELVPDRDSARVSRGIFGKLKKHKSVTITKLKEEN
ncbi:hypothetical protein MMC10_010388 [Thelotrema lepadinum]|nr:hypothetical protein [Thelotrema lepadinum]